MLGKDVFIGDLANAFEDLLFHCGRIQMSHNRNFVPNLIYFVTTDQPWDMRGKNIPSCIRGLGAESWTFISRRFDNANCHWEVLLEMRKELDKHFRYALKVQKNDSEAELPDG
jgi:hypothetical protein